MTPIPDDEVEAALAESPYPEPVEPDGFHFYVDGRRLYRHGDSGLEVLRDGDWQAVEGTRPQLNEVRPFAADVIEAFETGRLDDLLAQLPPGYCGTPIIDALALIGRRWPERAPSCRRVSQGPHREAPGLKQKTS
jgi:hypothetical protein